MMDRQSAEAGPQRASPRPLRHCQWPRLLAPPRFPVLRLVRRCNMASTFAQINDHAVDPTSIAARHHIACWSLQDHMHRGVKLASRVTRRAHRLARLAGSSPKGKKVSLLARIGMAARLPLVWTMDAKSCWAGWRAAAFLSLLSTAQTCTGACKVFPPFGESCFDAFASPRRAWNYPLMGLALNLEQLC